MKKYILSTILLSLVSSGAQAAVYFSFENAITLCPPPNNPRVNALMRLGGNVFGDVKPQDSGENEITFTGELVDDPGACNAAIMASPAPVGKFTLKMGYRTIPNSPDRPLYCRLTVERNPDTGTRPPRRSTYCTERR